MKNKQRPFHLLRMAADFSLSLLMMTAFVVCASRTAAAEPIRAWTDPRQPHPTRSAGDDAEEAPLEAQLLRSQTDLAEGRLEEAISGFRSILEIEPNAVAAHAGLARAEKAAGRTVVALPRVLGTAERFARQGRVAEAETLARVALELNSESIPAHSLLGRLAALDRRYSDGVAHYEVVDHAGRLDQRGALYFGSCLWEVNRLDEAESTYRRAVTLSRGESFVAFHQLGRLLLWQGRADEAVEPLRQAVRRNSSAVDAGLDLARALEGSGNAEAAIKTYEDVIRKAPSSSHARWGLAQVLRKQGRLDEARQQLIVYQELYAANQTRVRDTGLLRARLDRGWQLLSNGEIHEAMAAFRALGESVEAFEGLARAQSIGGDHPAAIETLERAIALDPQRQDLRLLLAAERLAAERAATGDVSKFGKDRAAPLESPSP